MSDDSSPAEQSGAASLDPSPDNPANAAPRDLSTRSSPPPTDVDDSALAQQIVRRRRRRRTGKGFFAISVLCVLIGLALFSASIITERDVRASSGYRSRTFLGTPILSARRVPDLVVAPVATRNLSGALDGALGGDPPSICVEFSDGARPLASHNPTTPLIPASNLKIVTAVAAVQLLGVDSRLQTRFMTDGKPTDGSTVKGNLYMVGGGDPLLTTRRYAAQLRFPDQPQTDLDAVADKVVATGIRQVTGSIVGDASRYDSERGVPSWPSRYFAQAQVAPLSALLVDDGWAPGVGPAGDPALQAAAVMTELLRARGVVVDGAPSTGAAPGDATALLDVPSLTIGQLAAQALSFSDNTTAELLLKEIGRVKGNVGSTAAGVDAVMKWAADRSLPLEGVKIVDGSGLSPENRLTCALLTVALGTEGPESVVAGGLAVPGQPGTLHDRFLQPPLRDSVRAKTGTLNGVSALSGWLKTTSGLPIAFSMIINAEGRAVTAQEMGLQTSVLKAGMSYPQAPALETLEPLPVRAVE